MKAFFDELKKDHQEVKDILQKLSMGSQTAEKTREKMFAQLKKELVPHLKAEDTTFYQALLAIGSSRKQALEAKEEHDLTTLVFRQLEETPAKEEIWGAKLKVLKDLVEHHIEEEEKEIFKLAQKEMEKADFKEIMQNFQKEKERIKGEIS